MFCPPTSSQALLWVAVRRVLGKWEGFYVATPPSVSIAELKKRLCSDSCDSGGALNSLDGCLTSSICSIPRSEQLVFQSRRTLQFDPFFLEIRYTFQHICLEALGYLNHFLVYFPRHKRYHVWSMWNENVKVFGWVLSTENIFAYCSFSAKTLKWFKDSLKSPL